MSTDDELLAVLQEAKYSYSHYLDRVQAVAPQATIATATAILMGTYDALFESMTNKGMCSGDQFRLVRQATYDSAKGSLDDFIASLEGRADD